MRTLLIIAGLIFSTANYAQKVGINTDNPQATLHIEGDMIIDEINLVDKARILGIDADGKIHDAVPPPRKYAFAESGNDQHFNDEEIAAINAGTPVEVSWVDADVTYNTLVAKDGNTFVFNEDVFCQVSGFVGYRSFSTVYDFNREDYVLSGANISIQYRPKDSQTWETLSTVTQLWYGPEATLAKTVIIPDVVKLFRAGDRVRMAIAKTSYLPHRNKDDNNTGIANITLPPGGVYSKGIKLMSL